MSRYQQHAPEEDAWVDDPDEERGSVLEVILTVGAALLVAFLVQQYLVKPFKIPSGSMENTLRCDDRVLADRLSYRFGDPARGDVVVFHPPAGIGEGGKPDPTIVADESSAVQTGADHTRTDTAADTNYIKRIVGLPGDTVEVKQHHAWVDGVKLKESYLHPLPTGTTMSDPLADWGPKEVPKGTYLMLGDHRDNSSDGRRFGFVPREFIVGRAFFVYWPPRRLGGLPKSDPGGAQSSAADPNCDQSGVPAGQFLERDG